MHEAFEHASRVRDQHGPHQGRALGVGCEPRGEIHRLAVGAVGVLVVVGRAPSEVTHSAGKDDGGLVNEELVDVSAETPAGRE